MNFFQGVWANEVSRQLSLIRSDGCAWGDLVNFDPSLQGKIVVDQAMLAMWTSVLFFLARRVQDKKASIGDLRLPDNFVVEHDLSNEEFVTSISMCALLLRNSAVKEDGKLACEPEGGGLKLGEPCSIEISLAQLTLIETSLTYVLDHAVLSFREWVSLSENNNSLVCQNDSEEEIDKLEEILVWCREDVLGVANLLCREDNESIH